MSTPPVDVQASWPHFDLQRFEGALKLSHLGLIECAGTDASDFLQQQLTQEMLLLPPGSSCLAGFCNAKGRLQASMVVIKESQERLLLILPMDMLPRTIKRLSMFVLRAKVKLSDVSASHTVMGLMGESALAKRFGLEQTIDVWAPCRLWGSDPRATSSACLDDRALVHLRSVERGRLGGRCHF